MKKRQRFLLIPLLLLILSCSGDPPVELPDRYSELENVTIHPMDIEPASEIELYPEVSYGDTDEIFLGQITGTGVDDTGRVFIADNDKKTIHVYSSDGEHLMQLGGEGKGPGEFGNVSNLMVGEEYLYAYDWSQRRVNVFSLDDFEFSHTIPLMREDMNVEELSGRYPGQFYLRNDSTLLVSYTEPFQGDDLDEVRHHSFYEVDMEGRILPDKIFEHRMGEMLYDQIGGGGFMFMVSPFGRKPLMAVDKEDKIYLAWSEDFLVKVHHPDGTYERAFYYPYRKSPMDVDEVIAQYENESMHEMVRSADAPKTWPALNSLTVDDENRLWISTYTDDGETYDWWVVDEYGGLLGLFTWPRERMIQTVKNGYLYARQTDEMDLTEIVRYQVWMDGSEAEG